MQTTNDEKREAQAKLEVLLMEGIQSSDPTEMRRTGLGRHSQGSYHAVRSTQIPESADSAN